MPQVDGAIIRDRAARLRDAGSKAVAAYLKGQVGAQHAVLTESATMGRTEHFAEVQFTAPQPVGQIVPARITGLGAGGLIA
jgi:threonylcarbamoyladenosine tRNA methylthiotransferase MtaB